MASDGTSGKIPATSLVQGSQAVRPIGSQQGGGKPLPPIGKNVPHAAAASGINAANSAPTAVPAARDASPPRNTDPQSLVAVLNGHLNDSGRPDQFRLDPKSGGKLIQQINPATGEVIGVFPVSEFPALARSVGASSFLIDSLA